MLANVKIEQDKEDPIRHKVYINGNKIQRITHMDFSVKPCETPWLRIKTCGIPNFEGSAEVSIECEPTVEDSCKILRDELLKHGDLYNGFLESMKSVIQESEKWEKNDWVCNSYDEKKEDLERLAELMLKRIIGEE